MEENDDGQGGGGRRRRIGDEETEPELASGVHSDVRGGDAFDWSSRGG